MESGLKGEEEEGGLLHLRAASGGLGGWEAIGGGGGPGWERRRGFYTPGCVQLGGKRPFQEKKCKKENCDLLFYLRGYPSGFASNGIVSYLRIRHLLLVHYLLPNGMNVVELTMPMICGRPFSANRFLSSFFFFS